MTRIVSLRVNYLVPVVRLRCPTLSSVRTPSSMVDRCTRLCSASSAPGSAEQRGRLRCPVCALPTVRLRCTPTAAQLSTPAASATGSAGVLRPDSHLRFESVGTPTAKKLDPIGVELFWHILRNLIQCNAKRPSVAFVKLPRNIDF